MRRRSFRRRSNRGTMVVPRNIIPNMTIVTLPWVDTGTFTLNAGNGHYEFINLAANGANTPSPDAPADKPYGWDQWETWYRTYTVLSSKMTVTFNHSSSTANINQIIVGMSLQRLNQSTNYTQLPTVSRLAHPSTVSYTMGRPASARSTKILSYTYNAPKFWRTKTLTDNDLEAETQDVPTNNANFIVWAANVTGGASIDTIEINIRIKYKIAYRHPRILDTSP